MTKKTIIVFMLTVMFVVPYIPAADQPAPKTGFSVSELKFETIEGPFREFPVSNVPGMEYIARFGLDTDQKFRMHQNWGTSNGRMIKRWNFIEDYGRKILKTDTGKNLSSDQKEFVLKGYALVYLSDDSEFPGIYVTGVDKEQTRKTAIAFLECLDRQAEEKFSICRANFLQLEKEYQKLVKELEPLEKKLKAIEEKYEKQKACTHYLSQEAAFNAIERMNAVYEENIIKLRVLKAKENVVTESLSKQNAAKQDESSKKDDSQPITAKLQELLIDINIALAEVDATVQSAEEIRLQAEQFIRYEQEYNHVFGQYAELSESVDKAKQKMIGAGDLIASPSKDMLPPKVIENKITLQSVKQLKY